MMISRRPILLGVACAALTVTEACAQQTGDFLGEWHGVLDLGPQRLRLRLVVTEGPQATLYSVDQGNDPIPVQSTRIVGARLMLNIQIIRARYVGQLIDGRIEGHFTQGSTLPLVFQRSETTSAPAEPLTQMSIAALRAQLGSPGIGAAASKFEGRNVAFVDGVRAIGQPQAIRLSDQWHLGSITKSMTATLVARAVEAGSITWDDTISSLLGSAVPDMREEYREVTFRHLLSHGGGMQANIEAADLSQFPRESADSRADRIGYARLGLMQAPAGPKQQTFIYSNTGYVVAAAMLEAKTGAPWETLIKRHLFDPLAMASAGFGAPGAAAAYDQPVGHAAAASSDGDRPVPLVPYPPGAPVTDNPAALGPAGRVHANLDDVQKFLAAHRDRTALLAAQSWQVLHTPPFGGSYAMGWQIDGGRLWHNGSNTLWYAEVLIDRDRNISAVAAVNDGRINDVRPVVANVLASAAEAVA